MFKVIDIHVHMQPLAQMKPECRELIRKTQPNFDFILELVNDAGKFVALPAWTSGFSLSTALELTTTSASPILSW